MARIGSFDAELRPEAWFDPTILSEGWYDYGLPFSHDLIGTEEAPPPEELPPESLEAFPYIEEILEEDGFEEALVELEAPDGILIEAEAYIEKVLGEDLVQPEGFEEAQIEEPLILLPLETFLDLEEVLEEGFFEAQIGEIEGLEEIPGSLMADVDFPEEFDLVGLVDTRGEVDEPPPPEPLPPPVIRKAGDIRVSRSRYGGVEIKIE
jgi:hypothetical protein